MEIKLAPDALVPRHPAPWWLPGCYVPPLDRPPPKIRYVGKLRGLAREITILDITRYPTRRANGWHEGPTSIYWGLHDRPTSAPWDLVLQYSPYREGLLRTETGRGLLACLREHENVHP